MNILFVCTGNTCRSPMAEALLKEKDLGGDVQSAGIFANHGTPINIYAQQALQERGITFNHVSQPVSEALLQHADIVLVMTTAHEALLQSTYPDRKEKIQVFKRYILEDVTVATDEDISDPFGQEFSAYQETLTELHTYIRKLAEKIENR